jgi:hypothetical protein
VVVAVAGHQIRGDRIGAAPAQGSADARGVPVRAGVQVTLDCGLELVNGLLLVRLRGPQPGQVLACTGFNEKGIAATSSPTASRGGRESRSPQAAATSEST